MHKIFISYSRSDYSIVTQLISEIEHLTGEGSCWFDLTGIESDSQFIDVIIDAIDHADIFLFMYSQHSERSEWTRKEIEYANGEKKRIVFVKIDNTPLSKYFKFQFSGHDIIDISDRLQKQKLFGDLACWCGQTTAAGRTNEEEEGSAEGTSRDITESASPIIQTLEKIKGALKLACLGRAVRFVLHLFIKTLLYLNALFSVFYFMIPCTDDSDSGLAFMSGLLFVLCLTAWLCVHFSLINITLKNKTEKILLFGVPLLFYLGSFIVCQCKEQKEENVDTHAELSNDTIYANPTKILDDHDQRRDGDTDTIDTNPTYPGGNTALQQDLSKNLIYPSEAQDTGIQGRVMVRFKVRADGTISDITIEKSLSPKCDQAAMAAVRQLSRFKPAQRNGHNVAAWLHLPITFRLN